MHKGDLIITNKTRRRVVKSMQVLLEEQSKAYFNFINSLRSEATKEKYKFCLEKFLNYNRIDLLSFLKLPQQDMTNLIIKYLVDKKVSRQYKNLITATLKHACEINDIVLNWKKIKKFINYEKTGNEIAGRDRGYTHQEIQQILNFSDQRVRTAFLILSSTGIRIGALRTLRVGDLEKIDGNIYKVTVYSGDKEQYITFTTPECTKEIDTYLDFRARHGEKITDDSFLRELINVGISEDKIIKDLKISRMTFFRYKKRIQKEMVKNYERESKDATQYEYAMLKKALEDCYRINYQIANDVKKPPQARITASEMFVIARAQLVKLAENGPTFKPQLTR